MKVTIALAIDNRALSHWARLRLSMNVIGWNTLEALNTKAACALAPHPPHSKTLARWRERLSRFILAMRIR